MQRYTGLITFVYYRDFDYGNHFMEEVLGLEVVMNQGWAKVYKINEKAFVGTVLKEDAEKPCDTLVSFNTLDVMSEHKRLSKQDVYELTDVILLESIPLKSFFFQDKEGHRFEIQEFLKEEDKVNF